ncbi:uncharacterized protein K452DRAFT_320331 [Aplosporella prunicola CBS 121167]|uniref:BAG domain-containing protein n=1 Tax=Aplosporella prunicola CBS 121167 TaxID=1176127 RepID=A0A6A6B8N6_9PEZI|nr:uncharacterized protein K452DRAFT_320331 [Aplosporella prunicola CBS 121167]KAF2139723.1 hypothetical protein K452DRAFT_320331 [Aplosporella prunicola CBS 121167]
MSQSLRTVASSVAVRDYIKQYLSGAHGSDKGHQQETTAVQQLGRWLSANGLPLPRAVFGYPDARSSDIVGRGWSADVVRKAAGLFEGPVKKVVSASGLVSTSGSDFDTVSATVLVFTLILGVLIGILGVRTMSSWSSRFGSWSGKFSPFGRGDSSTAPVTDADFSYITAEDLAASQKNLAAGSSSGDTDALVLKHKRVSYPVHFARGAIASGALGVRDVRAAAARQLGVDDASRVKLFHKGRQLKDGIPARAAGLAPGMDAEILCVVAEGAPFGAGMTSAERAGLGHGGGSGDDDDDDDDDGDEDGSAAPGGASKKKKKRSNRRGGKKSRKAAGGGGADSSGTATPNGGGVYSTGGAGAEFLGGAGMAGPIPPAHKPAPAPAARPAPLSPLAQLDAIEASFRENLEPLCEAFMRAPPADPAKRDFEHKKLSETVLAQVLLKLDAVDTAGEEEARARRKELVRLCNRVLGGLDEVVKS